MALPLYLQENLSQRLRERLDQFVIEKAGEGLKVTVRVLEGEPYVEIIEAAKGRDLIVMGTHGRTGLSYLLLGSVAERVVRGSEIPVLTIARRARPNALMRRDGPSLATVLVTNSDGITGMTLSQNYKRTMVRTLALSAFRPVSSL